ncbi:MAG: HlyD family efflux transporter periplasmic adaptor subunit [Butyricicoccaceae bacterium]
MANKKKHPISTLRALAIFSAVIILYLGIHLVANLYNPVDTVAATKISVDDSLTATGYFIRDEQIVNITNGDTVEYSVSNGDKVAKGAELATVYEDPEALQTSRKLNEINDTIEQLRAAIQGSFNAVDSSKLDKQIINSIASVAKAVDSGNLSEIPRLSSELRKNAMRRGYTLGDTDTMNEELEVLETQASELESSVIGKTKQISSEYAGYFCESLDGYETVFLASEIDDLTLDDLDRKADNKSKSSADSPFSSVKIIQGSKWYFAFACSDEDAERFKEGTTVGLKFAQLSENVPATVYRVSDDTGSDQTLVILSSYVFNEELVGMRIQSADIVFASYTGLRVPKEAVHMRSNSETGEETMGVYVMVNGVSRFKQIEKLYESSSYYVVRMNVTGDDSLVLNDDIIISAKDLDEKKVFK